MRINSTVAGILLASTAAFAAPAAACEAAGDNTHVGQVLQIDRDGGTFSIMDAEKMTAIEFSASDAILDKLGGNGDDMAMVSYEDTGNGLTATRVVLQ